MIRFLFVAIPIAAAGCGSQPRIEYRAVETTKVIQIPCAESLPEKPYWATEKVSVADEDYDILLAVLRELEQRRDYQTVLENIILTCNP